MASYDQDDMVETDSHMSGTSQGEDSDTDVPSHYEELLPNGVILSSDVSSEIKSQNINEVFFETYNPGESPLQSMYRQYPKDNDEDVENSSTRRSGGKQKFLVIAVIVVCIAAIGVALGVILPSNRDSPPSTSASNGGETDTNTNTIDDAAANDADVASDAQTNIIEVNDTAVTDMNTTNSTDSLFNNTLTNETAVDCQYGDNVFRTTVLERLYIAVAGVESTMTDEEEILYASNFMESYNSVAGCNDIFKRQLDSITLEKSIVVPSQGEKSAYMETELLISLSYVCHSDGACPDVFEPFFSSLPSAPSKRTRKNRVRGRKRTRTLSSSLKAVNAKAVVTEFESQVKTNLWTSIDPYVAEIASGPSKIIVFTTQNSHSPVDKGWTDKLSDNVEFRAANNP